LTNKKGGKVVVSDVSGVSNLALGGKIEAATGEATTSMGDDRTLLGEMQRGERDPMIAGATKIRGQAITQHPPGALTSSSNRERQPGSEEKNKRRKSLKEASLRQCDGRELTVIEDMECDKEQLVQLKEGTTCPPFVR
jgi:hypothetical protein